jgi:uncharacterized membrane protein YbaN (DUF454 family)
MVLACTFLVRGSRSFAHDAIPSNWLKPKIINWHDENGFTTRVASFLQYRYADQLNALTNVNDRF